MRVLVDTSVWIAFFRGVASAKVTRLEKAIHDRDDICTCGFVLTEVLQGIRADKEFVETKLLFADLIYLETERAAFEFAARIYRELRRKGITIRKPIDCMIVATALRHDVTLLDDDHDFAAIQKHYPLKRL